MGKEDRVLNLRFVIGALHGEIFIANHKSQVTNARKAGLMESSSLRQIKIGDARQGIPTQDGKPFASMFRHGSLEVEIFSPKGADTQKPHSRDELYVVASGTGWFFHEGRRLPFSPGDVLFAAAGEVHRFEDFSDDFLVWVIFYGPEGGERGD